MVASLLLLVGVVLLLFGGVGNEYPLVEDPKGEEKDGSPKRGEEPNEGAEEAAAKEGMPPPRPDEEADDEVEEEDGEVLYEKGNPVKPAIDVWMLKDWRMLMDMQEDFS